MYGKVELTSYSTRHALFLQLMDTVDKPHTQLHAEFEFSVSKGSRIRFRHR